MCSVVVAILDRFQIIHNHFDRHLSKEDKQCLDFGGIFVEQLLCKNVR